MEECCNMKGFLEFLTLALIHQKNCSGAAIRLEIEKRKGFKPSPGTIYPVLKSLQQKGFIEEVKGRGKEKKYTMTVKGKKEFARSKNVFVCLFRGLY